MTTTTRPASHPVHHLPNQPTPPRFETWVNARARELTDAHFAANAFDRAHVRHDAILGANFEVARREFYARPDVEAWGLHEELRSDWLSTGNQVRNRLLRERNLMQVCLDFRWLSAVSVETRTAFDADVEAAVEAKLMSDPWYLDHIARIRSLDQT